jgi:hypothetical protein
MYLENLLRQIDTYYRYCVHNGPPISKSNFGTHSIEGASISLFVYQARAVCPRWHTTETSTTY